MSRLDHLIHLDAPGAQDVLSSEFCTYDGVPQVSFALFLGSQRGASLERAVRLSMSRWS